MQIKFCYIRESYFKEHSNFIRMLDPGKFSKQSQRTHICVSVQVNENTFYIPLRNNLGDDVRKFGRIGYAVPSEKRPKAGLDFRYALIVNDASYVENHTVKKIPEAQYQKVVKEYDKIVRLFEIYLRGYIRAARKKRTEKEPLYRVSSLINYHSELNL